MTKATLVLGCLALATSPVAALTNTSCPESGQYQDNLQQLILPWDWSQQTWITNINFIVKHLPKTELTPVISGLWSITSAIWGSQLDSDNTVHQIMSKVYALVEQVMDSSALATLNTQFDTMNYEIQEYWDKYTENETGGDACESLKLAEDQAVQAYYTMVNYAQVYGGSPPAHIFLNHLLALATLHLGIYREMHYNGTEPRVCCDPVDDSCISSGYYQQQASQWYASYRQLFLDWLPVWYEWRINEFSSGCTEEGLSGDYTWKLHDKVTGMSCSGTVQGHGECDSWHGGTQTAIANESVATMLVALDAFGSQGLQRLVPGRETWPLSYPPADAKAPLNMYRTGIWVGPYRRWGTSKAQLAGYRASNWYVDNLGVPTGIYGVAGNSLYWLRMKYTYGWGKQIHSEPDMTEKFQWLVDEYSPGGWIEWLTLKGWTYNVVGAIKAGFNNSHQDYNVTPWMGGKNPDGGYSPWMNMTLASGYALVGIAQGGINGPPSEGTVVGVMASAWMPAVLCCMETTTLPEVPPDSSDDSDLAASEFREVPPPEIVLP